MIWADNVRKRLNAVTMTDAGRVAARSVLPQMRTRIFDRGEDRSGAQIGSYSREPIYISLSQMTRTGVGEQTRGGKSKKFPGGYAQYKSAIGARGFNLRNFGVMMRDFAAPIETVQGTRLTLTFKQDRSKNIAENYPQAWNMSPEEKAIFTKVYTFELQKRLFRD